MITQPTGTAATREAGFSILEITMAFSLVAIGMMGFLGALISAQMLTRVTREMNLANAEIASVMESFREACSTSFNAALTEFHDKETANPLSLRGIGTNAKVRSVVVLDETQLNPPLDLNQDGDYLDTSLAPADVVAVAMRVKVSWNGAAGPREIEYSTIVARGGG